MKKLLIITGGSATGKTQEAHRRVQENPRKVVVVEEADRNWPSVMAGLEMGLEVIAVMQGNYSIHHIGL